MANQSKSKSVLIILGALFITTLTIQCTKEGVNAGLVSRALVDAPDSTVFSPFYDSNVVAKADAIPDVNDYAIGKGVLSIVKNNCASSSCHGGNIKPLLNTFADVKALVVPGNPDGSKLFQMVTTSDLNQAMPPINYGVDLSITEKTIIYNWILHGAKESPDLQDFRPSAISLITNGCASANCHNAATVGGEWARKSLITFAATDTINYIYINPGTGAVTNYGGFFTAAGDYGKNLS